MTLLSRKQHQAPHLVVTVSTKFTTPAVAVDVEDLMVKDEEDLGAEVAVVREATSVGVEDVDAASSGDLGVASAVPPAVSLLHKILEVRSYMVPCPLGHRRFYDGQ